MPQKDSRCYWCSRRDFGLYQVLVGDTSGGRFLFKLKLCAECLAILEYLPRAPVIFDSEEEGDETTVCCPGGNRCKR